MSTFVVVIPSRLASERLPRKPLLDIDGRTMIERVHAQAARSAAAEVIVATDSTEIADVCRGFGASVEMTAVGHMSGTDRIAEVAERRGWSDDQIVVNVQGDEPLLPPALIDQVAGLLAADSVAGMATLMTPLTDPAEYDDPNMVKLVTDRSGGALYFSRSPIPAGRGGGVPVDARRHIGLYAYRVRCLQQLAAAPVAPPERAERLEQLRALWLGFRIAVADAVEPPPRGVDTEDDLVIIRVLARQAASLEQKR
jgi:3-deoxy-manno-octulosonate cytidylyltransferase (CMP-KDO synthetase)